ncbi:uncharacterized protein LOC132192518 [Neocloeon triangulifer]|uniref:uncharacterized protein LOC132192518 n=1 Tax=Neocloeon triangulifer TaxID=2078957 RepID=UPI00286F911D|nr:uncharacterized protein LOC132192518 [Neocloeon triangulifer]
MSHLHLDFGGGNIFKEVQTRAKEDTKPDIENLLREGYTATDLDTQKPVVILLGNTGTGKSTFSKFLRRDPTLKIERNSGRRWIFTDGEDKIGSTKSHVSKTLFPNVDVDEQTGTQVVDCAGFQDTRSPEFDLLAGFFNKKILDSSERVKIVIVENIFNLQQNGNRDSFTRALQQTAGLIGANFDSFEGSLGIVATKVYGSDSDEDILFEIKAFLDDTLEHLREENARAEKTDDKKKQQDWFRQLRLLEYLLKGENVRLFWRPENFQMESIEENRQQLRKFVFETLTLSKPFAHEFQITVAAETVNFINEVMLKKSEDAMENEFQNLRYRLIKNFDEATGVNLRPISLKMRNIIEFCQNYLTTLSNVNSMEQVELFAKKRGVGEMNLLEIHFQVDKAKFFYQVVGKDFFDAVAKKIIVDLKSTIATKVNAELGFNFFLEYLINDFGTYEFLYGSTKVDQEIANVNLSNFKAFAANLRKWGFGEKTAVSASSLNPTEANVEALKILGLEMKQGEVEVTTRGTIVTFSGRYIILSKIKEQILTKLSASEIVLMASEKLFVDGDISLLNTHLKFFAPEVEIIGVPRKMHLRGESGKSVLGKAASCVRGISEASNGMKGNAGYSSGTFTLFALNIKNGHLLSVQTEGGDGGAGQTGGDGCEVKIYDWPSYIQDSIPDSHYLYICWPMLSNKHASMCSTSKSNEVRLMQDNMPPTVGGNGGIGGSKALPGVQRLLIRSKEAVKSVKTIELNGNDGAPGQGGKAGRVGAQCTFKKYQCSLPSKTSVKCTSAGNYYDCEWKFTPVADGLRIDGNSEGLRQYKFAESRLLEQAFEFYKFISKQNLVLEAENNIGQFLTFLFTSDQAISQFTTQDFLNMIDAAESNVKSAQHSDLRDTIQRLKFFYSAMLQSVRLWRKIRGESDSVMVTELTLISLLDTLEAFLHGKQVVRLSALVDAQLRRLTDVDKAIEQVGKFEAVAAEKKLLLSRIADAEKLMQNIYQRKIDEIKIQIDTEFDVLLQKTKQLEEQYKENDKVLVEHRKKIVEHMRKNVAMGVVSSISTLTGIFYPSAALIGPTVTGIAQAAASGPPSLQYESQVPRAIQNAKALFDKLERQKAAQQKDLIASAQEIIDADKNGKFLREENIASVKDLILTTSTEKNSLNSIDITSLFIAVDLDLKAKIAELKDSNGDGNEIAKLDLMKKRLQTTRYIANSGLEVAKTFSQYSNDQSVLDQVDAAIKQNQENLKEMAVYEENLHKTFKPLVEQMVKTFDSLKSNLKTQNTFELLFQQLDLKSYARKCVSMVQKLTQDLFSEDEGFATILTELQELLTTLIDAYDKIEELRYRVPLADFAGKLAGVKCLSTSDPDACNSLQKTAQSIKTNELVREFAYVFAAYQQVSFPFGANRMQLLNTTHLSLRSEAKEKIAEILRSVLESIRDDLSSSSTSIQNHLDADVVLTEFSSRFVSTQPFFVWPNVQFSRQIADLLNGERVTLMASVPGSKNAVKFNWVALNMTSKDEDAAWQVHNLLKHFRIEMVHGGESYFRCGGAVYAIGGADLTFTLSFERDEKGNFVTRNKVQEKLSTGDVPLSPYVMWKFKLIYAGKEDPKVLFHKLGLLSKKVDLELVGEGSYVAEGAAICDSDLSRAYNYVNL